jgi:membrane associated rhomboid family serine protease
MMPTYRYGSDYSFGRPWSPVVRALIITNILVFLAQLAAAGTPLPALLGIQVPEMFTRLRWWQPCTYLFLHAGFWHLAFNMFALWMFGTEVEQSLGSPRFLIYYLFTGIGAGWCVALIGWLAGEHNVTLGASGAIFGVLMAYGILFAERTITLLLFFILPVQMKAKTMVLFFAAFEFIAGVGNAVGQISHIAHLSGLALGWLFFRVAWPRTAKRFSFWEDLRAWWVGRRVRRISSREDPETYLDQILEKISKQGITALSAQEREILAEASRRRRGSWPDNN